ncbi:MAG TPA: hypothetical protein VIH86_02675, partial [Puia sp.]
DNNSYSNHTIEFTFTELIGYRSPKGDKFRATIPARSVAFEICTIEHFIANEHRFRYSHKLYNGINVTSPDSTFTYLIPAVAGHEVTSFHVSYFGNIVGKYKPGYYAVRFRYHAGDTICAARAGIVYEVFDNAERRTKGEYYNEKTHNYINIEQADGTLAHYSIASPIHLLVIEGDRVIPGQPIAVFSAEDYNYPLVFRITHLNLDSPPDEEGSYYSSVNTNFYTQQNTTATLGDSTSYIAIQPVEIVTKELSKKEIKKLGLKN